MSDGATDSGRSSYLLGVTRWRTWVLAGILRHIPRSAALVATYLANRSGASGGAWPSVKTIRDMTGLGRGQIFRGLKLLGPQSLGILGTVHGKRGRVKGNRGYLGPRLYWIEEPSEAAIEKAICTAKTLKEVSAADTYKARERYPQRRRIRSGHGGSIRSGYMTCSYETKREPGIGDSLVRPPSGAPASASPSQGRASKVQGEGAPLQNAGAPETFTLRELDAIAGIVPALTPLGKTEGASPPGVRVHQARLSPPEVPRVRQRVPRCRGLTRDRSTCQYPAGASGFCHRHEPQGKEGAMASREQS